MSDMTFPASGRCQCGSVTYQLLGPPLATLACHCTDCQKLSASSFSITMILSREHFELLTGELKSWQRPTASGGTAVCWFCPECGNRIYHEDPDRPQLLKLKPGTLDDTSVLQPMAHVWTCREQPWLTNLNDIPRIETQPDLVKAFKALQEGRSPF